MDKRAVTDPSSALTSAWRSSTRSVTSWNSACAWHTNACPRAVTAPSTPRRWCPRPPSLMRCSPTACPTHSTWRSSKPRLPVPRTFTPPCWTAPTRSRARRLHRPRAPGAPCEGQGRGWGRWRGRGGGNEEWPERSRLSLTGSSRLSTAADSRGQQRPAGRLLAPSVHLGFSPWLRVDFGPCLPRTSGFQGHLPTWPGCGAMAGPLPPCLLDCPLGRWSPFLFLLVLCLLC